MQLNMFSAMLNNLRLKVGFKQPIYPPVGANKACKQIPLIAEAILFCVILVIDYQNNLKV